MTAPIVHAHPGGVTVEADTLEAALLSLATHPFVKGDGVAFVHGMRMEAGRASIVAFSRSAAKLSAADVLDSAAANSLGHLVRATVAAEAVLAESEEVDRG